MHDNLQKVSRLVNEMGHNRQRLKGIERYVEICMWQSKAEGDRGEKRETLTEE